jgi:hypothetical protein
MKLDLLHFLVREKRFFSRIFFVLFLGHLLFFSLFSPKAKAEIGVDVYTGHYVYDFKAPEMNGLNPTGFGFGIGSTYLFENDFGLGLNFKTLTLKKTYQDNNQDYALMVKSTHWSFFLRFPIFIENLYFKLGYSGQSFTSTVNDEVDYIDDYSWNLLSYTTLSESGYFLGLGYEIPLFKTVFLNIEGNIYRLNEVDLFEANLNFSYYF